MPITARLAADYTDVRFSRQIDRFIERTGCTCSEPKVETVWQEEGRWSIRLSHEPSCAASGWCRAPV